ncbi:MAG TPA: hypothetical protein VHE55_14685 [Fimbriimonadaceae bacterium]|nr:hypothetical protein [Fimbriimonadaceae bacterium]
MRTLLTLILLATFCAANATFKDPRKLHPVAPLTQEEVARQQALQKGQSEIGAVPQKTDDTGYSTVDQADPQGAAIVAAHGQDSDSADSARQALQTNNEAMNAQAEQPKKMAFGAFWAIAGGLLLAGGVWAGLQKYGPKPPEHILRGS